MHWRKIHMKFDSMIKSTLPYILAPERGWMLMSKYDFLFALLFLTLSVISIAIH